MYQHASALSIVDCEEWLLGAVFIPEIFNVRMDGSGRHQSWDLAILTDDPEGKRRRENHDVFCASCCEVIHNLALRIPVGFWS